MLSQRTTTEQAELLRPNAGLFTATPRLGCFEWNPPQWTSCFIYAQVLRTRLSWNCWQPTNKVVIVCVCVLLQRTEVYPVLSRLQLFSKVVRGTTSIVPGGRLLLRGLSIGLWLW